VLVAALVNEHHVNLMTAAWCMPVSASPPMIAISIAPRRFTHELILRNREFTINIMSMEHLKEVHYCGTVSGRAEDKLSRTGFTLEKSSKIRTPYLREAVAALECVLANSVRAGDHTLFLGEVVEAHVRRGIFDRKYLIDRVDLILYVGEGEYTTTLKSTKKP